MYIVPTGIEYGDYFRYRSTSLVTFGKPINVTEVVKELNLDNEAQIMDHLRKNLTAKMSELITYINYDEDYAAKWALTKIRARGLQDKLYAHMRKHAVEKIVSDEELATVLPAP